MQPVTSPSTPVWKRLNWVNLIFLSVTAAGALVLPPVYLHVEGWHWGLFALFAVSALLTNLAITAGYHRLYSHRSYDANRGVKLAYLLVGAAAFQGSALMWSADHRRHHRFVDTERDPHNINKGFWWAHIGWLLVKEPEEMRSTISPDLAQDPMLVWQDKYYPLIGGLMGFVLPTLIGWSFGHAFGGFVFGGLLRVFVTNHCTFFVNSLAHYIGTQPYSNQTARDSVIMAFLACGEGYHNYHHQFASDYRNGVRWYQWDPTKWLIRSLSFFGWTYRLKRVPATTIFQARLRHDQQLLIQRGLPPDHVTALMKKVEMAQARFRQLREDYRAMKRDVQARSRYRLDVLKAEIRAARQEFKRARAQWGTVKKKPDWAAFA